VASSTARAAGTEVTKILGFHRRLQQRKSGDFTNEKVVDFDHGKSAWIAEILVKPLGIYLFGPFWTEDVFLERPSISGAGDFSLTHSQQ
jgi:hypothetical protein